MRLFSSPSLLALIGSSFLAFATATHGAVWEPLDPVSATSPSERIRFDQDWKFFLGDAPDAAGTLGYKELRPFVLGTSGLDLLNACAVKPVPPAGNPGGTISFVQPGFDDQGWKSLTLPHDWAITGPFSAALPGETGKLPWQGVGWYRKTFHLDSADSAKQIALDIDGAMSYSSIWLNGHYVGGWPYGYTSYRLDLTRFIIFGADNVLAIRLENPPQSSRWYPGAGVYRDVWLVKKPAVRLRHWGVFVTTPRVTDEVADVQVDINVENKSGAAIGLQASVSIHELNTDDTPVEAAAATSEPVSLSFDPKKGDEAMRSVSIPLPHPQRWDLQDRHRYVAITTLMENGKLVDMEKTVFGVRTIAFTADQGFLLNGRRVLLQGVCLHHDEGALGTAVNRRALERQLQILQTMGCNAIRTSHNPPSPELLDLCDRMGFLVMDEAFDCWQLGKKKADLGAIDPFDRYHDYARIFTDWHERDLRALIRRDRNHPCIVLWSIGNEVAEQWVSNGWPVAAHLTAIVHEEDRTRPTTSAFNNRMSGYIGFQTAVDVVGYNYNPKEYPKFRQANPTIPVFGSETASTVSSRGEYFFPLELNNKLSGRADFQVSSYDLAAPRWASSPDYEWQGLDEAPFAAGEFVWTGFDYLGEPTPYNSDSTNLLNFSNPADQAKEAAALQKLGRIQVPSRSSYFGIVDLAGFPKDRYYLYQSRWRADLPMVHILPHWNWPERVGQVTPVHVYSSGDEVELFLNGKSLGRQKRAPLTYRFQWNETVYQPGELKAVAYKNAQPWAETVTRTTDGPKQVRLTADRTQLRADGRDLAFITVAIADDRGETVPRTHNLVTFSVEGPGEIAAVDNGDATSFESFQAPQHHVFNGLALVVIRTVPGKTGMITVKATSEGLQAAETTLAAAE